MATSTKNIPAAAAVQIILDSKPRAIDVPDSIQGELRKHLVRHNEEVMKWCEQVSRAVRVFQTESSDVRQRLDKLEGK